VDRFEVEFSGCFHSLTPSLPALSDWSRGYQDKIDGALAACGISSLRDRRATTLSGGELARAMLARAFVGNPDILIVDEPVSGLDPRYALDAAVRLRAFVRSGKLVIPPELFLTLGGHPRRCAYRRRRRNRQLGFGVRSIPKRGLAYQFGRKDSYPVNSTDHDLDQIAPLKERLALNYNYDKLFGQEDAGLFGTFELVHSNAASDIDEVVGEKRLASWDVFNLRLGYRFETWTLNLGVETCSIANTR
jgi:hypothetical protein